MEWCSRKSGHDHAKAYCGPGGSKVTQADTHARRCVPERATLTRLPHLRAGSGKQLPASVIWPGHSPMCPCDLAVNVPEREAYAESGLPPSSTHSPSETFNQSAF